MTCSACGLVHALAAPDTPVRALQNMDEASASWLYLAGISTLADLEAMGAVNAYVLLQTLGVKPGLNLLYALEGALHGSHWLEVKRMQKSALLLELKSRELASESL